MFWIIPAFRVDGRQHIMSGCVTALLLAGCVTRHYELEMNRVEGNLQRKVTVWEYQSNGNQERPIDKEELERVAELYETDVTKGETAKHSFTKIFTDRTPNDVGGNGTFTHWSTSLGSVTGYLERVRGDDDIASQLEKRKKAADRLVDLLIGWMEDEFPANAELPLARTFLDTTFRRDLINLGIYAETTEVVNIERSIQSNQCPSRERGEMEVLARMIQYCIERDYVTPRQIPEWGYAIDQAKQQRPDLLIRQVQGTLASKMGLVNDQSMPTFLARLSDIDRLRESLNRYLQTTVEYRELVAQNNPTTPESIDVDPPDPSQILSQLAAKAVFPNGLLAAGDRLTASLSTPFEPMATNGRWNSETRRVEWAMSIEGSRSEGEPSLLPDLLYAFWVEPTFSVQTELFGKVVLADESLLSYCLWYRGLPPEKVKRWDEFLATLNPASDLVSRIRAFRFDDEPTDTPTQSQTIRDLLVNGLQQSR